MTNNPSLEKKEVSYHPIKVKVKEHDVEIGSLVFHDGLFSFPVSFIGKINTVAPFKSTEHEIEILNYTLVPFEDQDLLFIDVLLNVLLPDGSTIPSVAVEIDVDIEQMTITTDVDVQSDRKNLHYYTLAPKLEEEISDKGFTVDKLTNVPFDTIHLVYEDILPKNKDTFFLAIFNNSIDFSTLVKDIAIDTDGNITIPLPSDGKDVELYKPYASQKEGYILAFEEELPEDVLKVIKENRVYLLHISV